jgi:hypothetical protein
MSDPGSPYYKKSSSPINHPSEPGQYTPVASEKSRESSPLKYSVLPPAYGYYAATYRDPLYKNRYLSNISTSFPINIPPSSPKSRNELESGPTIAIQVLASSFNPHKDGPLTPVSSPEHHPTARPGAMSIMNLLS